MENPTEPVIFINDSPKIPLQYIIIKERFLSLIVNESAIQKHTVNWINKGRTPNSPSDDVSNKLFVWMQNDQGDNSYIFEFCYNCHSPNDIIGYESYYLSSDEIIGVAFGFCKKCYLNFAVMPQIIFGDPDSMPQHKMDSFNTIMRQYTTVDITCKKCNMSYNAPEGIINELDIIHFRACLCCGKLVDHELTCGYCRGIWNRYTSCCGKDINNCKCDEVTKANNKITDWEFMNQGEDVDSPPELSNDSSKNSNFMNDIFYVLCHSCQIKLTKKIPISIVAIISSICNTALIGTKPINKKLVASATNRHQFI